MDPRLAAGGGPTMVVEVRSGDQGGLRGSRNGMDPRLTVGGGPTMVVEMRNGDRGGSLACCSMLVLVEAVAVEVLLSGRNCLVGSDVDGERMLWVPSGLASESNDIRDECSGSGDIGASSTPKSELRTLAERRMVRGKRTRPKYIRAPLHPLDPAPDPQEIDEGNHGRHENGTADGRTCDQCDGHAGGRSTGDGRRLRGTRGRRTNGTRTRARGWTVTTC
jgi:hypothetical protein